MVYRSQYVLGGMLAAAGGKPGLGFRSTDFEWDLGSTRQQVGQLLISVVASWNCQTVWTPAARGSPHLPSLPSCCCAVVQLTAVGAGSLGSAMA